MEHEANLASNLVALVALGVVGQWLASRTRIPNVLWMLGLAIVLGPVTRWLRPEELFGPLLLPLVSLSVAIILFEGSLELRWIDLRHIGAPLVRLLTIGAISTAVLAGLLAHFLLGMTASSAALLGSILIVTGPTVIGPILTAVRPSKQINQLLRWEGITIDPLGAVLALLVFATVESVGSGQILAAVRVGTGQLFLTIIVGVGFGYLGGRFLVASIARFLIPDHLYGVSSLAILLVVFETANRIQAESGLLAATVLGLRAANSHGVPLDRVHRFHQNLTALLIPTLFLLLGSRLDIGELYTLGWNGLVFAGALIFLVRPLSVFLSLAGMGIPLRERTFVAFLAPRGIVAAAVSSLFALQLGEDFQPLIPATFLVILTTVTFYGFAAGPLARLLGLSVLNPQGCLILGANRFGRELACVLRKEGISILMVDSNRLNIEAARMQDLPAKAMNVLSDAAYPDEELDLSEIGNFLAVTSNNEVNILACRHFGETFGRKHVFQLPLGGTSSKRSATSEKHVAGRILFAPEATHDFLQRQLEKGYRISATKTTSQYTAGSFLADNSDVLILFTISKGGVLQVFSLASENVVSPESVIIALRSPVEGSTVGTQNDEEVSSGVQRHWHH